MYVFVALSMMVTVKVTGRGCSTGCIGPAMDYVNMIILVELRETELSFIFLEREINARKKEWSRVVLSSPEMLDGCWWNGR